MQISRRRFLAAATFAATSCQFAQGDAPNPIQQRIAESFASKSVGSKINYDDAGNVVKLAISRHTGKKEDDFSKLPPGVTDAEFRDIVHLPMLQAIFIEKMPLSDESYALLGQLKHLKDVRIHYPAWAKTQTPDGRSLHITDRFGKVINDLPGLRVLQFKHIFRLNGDGLLGLDRQRDLEHLEIDTICAKSSAVPFVASATKLKNLQVHRCDWTDAELQQVFAALPELEVLELKPNKVNTDPIRSQSLRGLTQLRKLRLVQLTGQFADLNYKDGFDVFNELSSLQQLNLILKDVTVDSPLVKQLRLDRPDLLIKIGNESYGGSVDQSPAHVDDGYDWGGAVTTHG